ncbi:protocadherin-like wing polarity protein stan isoform X2 [Cylas formicarius]|uniref:protocadherin-like wing polarity protein stan isoform X2 n=1 Tax=Cylas formicarius TaxID=197179 RepID=UPI00295856C4|nr:protocadherin-like wing polarity protein stan isoform X2 [Cylas formicarius]XP_060527639.1 protocadherin-like wing polarity protein stan isoform X2 [Cylas formicarius]
MTGSRHHMGVNNYINLLCSILSLALCYSLSGAYLLLVDQESVQAGDLLFNVSVKHSGSDRYYELDTRRSAPFVQSLINVDRKSGHISLQQRLQCDGIFYPNLFTIFINSFSKRLKDLEYYSLPLRIFITGKDCSDYSEETLEHLDEFSRERRSFRADNNWNPFSHVHPSVKEKIGKAKEWVSETYASFAIPSAGKWKKICLKQSQFISSILSFLPDTITKFCQVDFHYVSDDRFKIERSQGDLVASRDVCIVEPMWKISISFTTQCKNISILNSEHRLKIIYHHQKFNDTDIARRVRRELRNQSPFFEKHLYVASVLEECEPPVVVTTVKARDPENNPISYSMTSLLDSRTQGMFDIDPQTGIVSTRVQLDRELVDVHYFRITATHNIFPPRSGTTMLQINVLDANDHAPVFEMTEYDASVRESVSVGTTVITLKATDQDIGKNSDVEYSIQSVNGGGMSSDEEDNQAFKIDPKTGVITTRTTLDRETTEVYTLVIEAIDSATPQSARKSSSTSVVINILDDNDNYPQFSERTYSVTLNEDINWSESPVVAHIKATDADQGANAAIRYAIISGNTQSQFTIDSLSGDVSLIKALDYEILRNYRLVIRAQDGGSPSKSNTTQLLINVRDVNDNAPRFYTTLFQESVQENVPSGYSIVKVQAYDADEGSNAEIMYTIAPRDGTGASTTGLPLSVDSHSGWVYTTKELDREDQGKFMFQVVATDKGVPPLSASASVIITVQDVNDNDPVFKPKLYEAVVAEDKSPGTPVTTVTATDADEDNRIHYEITNGNVRGRFAITSQNGRGVITVAQPLDYKQEKRYVLTVTASDSGGRTDTATVYINITDANNFAPVFENAPYSGSVYEDAAVGTTVLVVSATDNDVGLNAQITYSLGEELSSDSAFSINPQTGAVVTKKLLDREIISGYLLTVTATDGGSPAMSDTTDVEISVLDVNDNYPVFKQVAYSGSIPEDALVGTSVVQVAATDADVGLNGRIRYTLSEKDLEDGSFVIDPTSGVIRTNKGLDRESVAYYELEAYAIDRGSPTLSSSVPVTIRIEDINDSPPEFSSDKLVFYIPENSPVGSTVGEIYAKDPDEGVNAIVQYSIIGGEDSQSFSLITRPGSEKAELLTMTELDYETSKKKYDIIVRAASPPLRSDTHVEIIVTDVNDNAPVLQDFHVIFNNYKDCFPTGPIGRIPAFDADVSDKLVFKILSGNNAKLVALNESTGQLILSPQLNTNVPKIASMEVSVNDGINEVKAVMQLTVRLVTKDMLLNSITVQLNQMTKEAFLSPLLQYFIDALAAIIPCPRENVIVFSIQDDNNVKSKILNVSFSVKRPDVPKEAYYSIQFLQEKVYLNMGLLGRLSTVQILPFIDNLCVQEPCLNFEECVTVLKFGNASGFVHSDTILFRPIYPVTTFTCQCPKGFTGSREHYLCDTEVNLCYSSPCKNNGTCKIKEGGYTCVCTSGYAGKNCEMPMEADSCKPDTCTKDIVCSSKDKNGSFVCDECAFPLEHYTPFCELKSRSFAKSSFLTFPSLRQRQRLHLNMKFATRSQNGLLLYNGRYNEEHDFVALEIKKGDVQFQFSLGGSVTKVTASRPGGVSDGKWHTATVSYYNKTVTLSIDDCDTALALKHGKELGSKWACASYVEHSLESRCASLTETCYRFLDLTGPLQLGGLPKFSIRSEIQNTHFEGCIADFHIDHKFIDLNSFVTDNGTSIGCPEKRSYCNSGPCKNGGTCIDGWSLYKCVCPQGYGGKDCSQTIGNPWHFSGDGTLSFNPLLRPIQLPWLNGLSVRTLQEDTFLMSVQVGQNSSAVVSLQKGFLVYSFNEETISLNSMFLSDGEWHRIEVTWLGTEIKLSIDYGEYSELISFPEKIQGLYVGKILVGGPDNTYSSLNAGYSYLEGCIQDVRIGNQQSSLNRPTVKDNVEEGCFFIQECQNECPDTSWCKISWGKSQCECNTGHVGALCIPICTINPCDNEGVCKENNQFKKGYECVCDSADYSGEYCEEKRTQPCPASWWGFPVCGPCDCDVGAGYNPDCDKNTGTCHCRENHYQPKGSTECIPCDCYHVGSYNSQCDHETGECKCKEGVIGQKCDSCPNSYAEITLKGCEVVYDGCPRSSTHGIWWPRTVFGLEAIELCPKGSHGKVSRKCDNEMGGWQEPDMFNCTSDSFLDLREQLSNIESGDLPLNTFVVVKLGHDLQKATNSSKLLYGADVMIAYDLIKELLQYESSVHGLNLSHSQDKDYISNLVLSVNVILSEKYADHWTRINHLTGHSVEDLIGLLEKYINVLLESQHDTYTNPFEIVSPNVVLGLDIVTPESLYGYEPEITSYNVHRQLYTTESVILPDTSDFLQDNKIPQGQGPLVAFPKYNNYLLDKSKFDQHTRILLPLHLLGIKPVEIGEIITKHSVSRDSAIVSYVQYNEVGSLFPKSYHDSVVRRWGVDLTLGSPLITVSVLVPEYVDAIEKSTETINNFNDIQLPEINIPQQTGSMFMEPEVKIHENDARYFRSENNRMKRDKNIRKKLFYKSLSNIQLDIPIRLQIWLNSNHTMFNERSNPQCVHWSTVKGFGEWSRVGCRTEVDNDWFEKSLNEPLLINCSCNHLSTFAVLVDVVDLEYIPEPSLLEDISSYSSFAIALPLLLGTYLILALIRGLQTNSNTIRKNLVLCVFLAELLYFVTLKARKAMISEEFACKLIAIGLHYLWLASFCWMSVDAVHLYRMLTEMRDINHGPMRFYYSIGYVVPAVVVALSVGVRAHQYGNYYFCWVSLYESVIWSLVGPTCLLTFVNLCILVLCIRAAFTLQDHVLGFGNLRTLLWVSVISLPLLGATWVLALLAASERHPLLMPLLSCAVLIHAAFSLAGYCFANNRVRQNLLRTFMRCLGKKVPLLDTASVAGVPSTSSQNITIQSRSALAYHSSVDQKRRNIGISASSTTSRSTTKTSSSPYRSDTHLRNTSTSTSNYNSTSDVPSYLRSFDQTTNLRRREVTEQSDLKESRERNRGDSDSDSDGSEGRSLDLASSHSSDDDESSTKKHHSRIHMSARQGYLPNITEHVVSRCGTPPSLNVVTNSQLFPAIQPTYGSRWSSQLPESYLPNPNDIGRWSAETGSDNELLHKTSSPNPLPHPDVTSETCLPVIESEQYRIRTHYNNRYNPNMYTKNEYMQKMIPHENVNYQDYDRYSDIDEKHQMGDKYLFPYTDNICSAEEDHIQIHTSYGQPDLSPHPSNRMMSPVTNDLNNPCMDFHGSTGSRMGSRIGSVLGSLHGSAGGSIRDSPPLVPPVSMIHSGMPPEPSSWCWAYQVNK